MMDQTRIPSSPTKRASSAPIFSETSSMPSKIGNEYEFISAKHNSFSGCGSNRISYESGSPIVMSPWNQNSHFAKASWHNSFSGCGSNRISYESGSPIVMSPWNQNSRFAKASWHNKASQNNVHQSGSIICSIVREEGHIYSLAAKSDVLYTGSDSKNIRVWKNMQELSAFKSNSGLVKAIIINKDKIFTGHQDGRIRVWKVNQKNPSVHKRSGTLPTFIDMFKASIRPKNYIEVKRNRTTLWIKHCDAISSLSMCEEHGLLYSGSWDRTIKVWRIQDYKCLESINAHDDAVNSVVSSSEGIVYSGSADGTVKVWKRECKGKSVKHVFVQNLLKQESAVTALAVSKGGKFVYCGASDGVVHFWDKMYFYGIVLKGHKLAVLCLASAGNLVFSGSADKNICMWRRDGGVDHSCLAVLTGHDGPVKCLAVEEKDSSKGKEAHFVVYSGSLDKSVRVWSVSDLQEMDILQESGGDGNSAWDMLPPPLY